MKLWFPEPLQIQLKCQMICTILWIIWFRLNSLFLTRSLNAYYWSQTSRLTYSRLGDKNAEYVNCWRGQKACVKCHRNQRVAPQFPQSFVHNDNQLDVSRYRAEATLLFCDTGHHFIMFLNVRKSESQKVRKLSNKTFRLVPEQVWQRRLHLFTPQFTICLCAIGAPTWQRKKPRTTKWILLEKKCLRMSSSAAKLMSLRTGLHWSHGGSLRGWVDAWCDIPSDAWGIKWQLPVTIPPQWPHDLAPAGIPHWTHNGTSILTSSKIRPTRPSEAV